MQTFRCHAHWLLLVLACTGKSGGGSAAAEQVPSFAVLGSTAKVRPDEPVAGEAGAILVAARNEFESFQVAIQAGDDPLRGLVVEIRGPLVGPGGAEIPASQITIYRIDYIDVQTPSDLEGAPGRWPDPLIPAVDTLVGEARNAFPIDVPAKENRVAWVDIHIPIDAAPGIYEGELELRAEGHTSRVPMQLEVLAFQLPSTSSLRTAYGLSDDLCRPLGLGDCASDVELEARTRELFVRAALDNRVTIARPHSSRLTPESEAGLEAFRTWLLPLVQGTAATRLPEARLTAFQLTLATDRNIAPWKSEVELQGFEDRAFVCSCDEPHFFPVIGDPAGNWPFCTAALEADGAAWPEARRLVTAHIQSAESYGRLDLIDIMVVSIEFLDGPEDSPWFPGNQRPLYEDFLATPDRPRELWIYSSCGSHGCGRNDDPYTTGWAGGYEIDAPAAQTRAMGWLAFRYDVQGVLYYETVLQLASAWHDQYHFTGNGDGTLFYPGTPERIGGERAIPIESIRLKFLRDGFEDYEYLRFLASNGRAADAERIAAGLFPAAFDTSRTDAEVRAARGELIELVRGLEAP